MSATAAAIFEHVSPPDSIPNLPQFVELQKGPRATSAREVADPLPMLREALEGLQIMHEGLAALSIESDHDRAVMRDSAAKTNDVARLYYDLHESMIDSGLPRDHPVVTMCEDLAAGLEDVAETAALAGSEAFAIAIARELVDARTED